MSRKPVLWGSVALTLLLAAATGRADEFDAKLKQFQQQRTGEALALKAAVLEVMAGATVVPAAGLEAHARTRRLANLIGSQPARLEDLADRVAPDDDSAEGSQDDDGWGFAARRARARWGASIGRTGGSCWSLCAPSGRSPSSVSAR